MGLDNSRLIFYLYLREVLFYAIIYLWAKSCQLSYGPARVGQLLVLTYPPICVFQLSNLTSSEARYTLGVIIN